MHGITLAATQLACIGDTAAKIDWSVFRDRQPTLHSSPPTMDSWLETRR